MRRAELFWKKYSDLLRIESLPYLLAYIVASFILTKAFFSRWELSCIAAIGVFPVFLRKLRRYLSERRQHRTETEFYLMLRQVSMSLSSGATLENAVRETILADRKQYKVIGSELERVCRMLKNNYPAEQAFRVFARRCGNREILAFSEVLSAGIPAGINDLKAALERHVPAHLILEYLYRYLLIKEVHEVMTLTEMDATVMNKFAGG